LQQTGCHIKLWQMHAGRFPQQIEVNLV